MRTPFPPAAVVLFLGVLALPGCASATRDLKAGNYWPSGKGAWEWKPERLLLEFGAVQLNNVLTSGLKSATDRERPDGSEFEPETDADEPRVGVGARFVAVECEIPQE